MKVEIGTVDGAVIGEVTLGERTKPGWNKHVLGWSVGASGSGADLVVDEPLDGADLGIFPASNHVILSGSVGGCTALPPIEVLVGSRPAPATIDADGRLYLRFDRYPVRIGRHVLRFPR